MLLNNSLDGILGQASKVKILRFLVNSQAQLNGREIAKNVRLSHVKTHAALKDLSRHGLVNVRSVGKSLVYWLNEEHILINEIIRPMFEKEATFFRVIIKVILKTSKAPLPLSIALFGSFAKNNALPDSDIDVVIVYPDNKNISLSAEELAGAEKKITLLFGNRLAAIPMKIGEFRNKFQGKNRFIKEIFKTGKVIYGKSMAELLSYEQ